MAFRESSVKTYVISRIKAFLRSQYPEKVNPQNNVESVSFSARACWKARNSELTTLPSGLKKGEREIMGFEAKHDCDICASMLGTYINLRKRNVKRIILNEKIAQNREVLRNSESLSRGFSP